MNPLKSPPPTTTSKVPTTAISKAVTALITHKSTTTAAKPQLLPSDDFLYLVTTIFKIPSKPRVNAFKIPLPHPLHIPGTNSDLCLFVHDSNSAPVKSHIKNHNVSISKVIKLSKLKTDYKSYEQKRKLCDSYDLFLADKRIVPLLPNCLGKWFYKKKKIPVPVELGRGRLEDQVDRVVGSGLFYLGTGTCSVMRVARASMSVEEIVENVVAAVEGVAGVVPKRWGNVRSFHLKFAESLALPVYQKVPELGFRIESGVAAGGEEVKEGFKFEKIMEKKAKKKNAEKRKKGRIHEVRYMDEEVAMIGEDESESESESEGEEAVMDEEVVGKKRKKGVKELELKKDGSESEEEEAVVDEEVVGKKGVKSLKSKKVAIADEEVVGKKRKDGVKSLKSKKVGSEKKLKKSKISG